jgi:asparagine synthase (glutamine-hydrolysing)
MCGIAGMWFGKTGRPADGALLKRMCDQIVHRGPDDQGVHVKDVIGLGMRRLSIIDLSTGHQPIFNEDGTVCVVFNGEIYNFQELRDELERLGHKFSTRSDTEVIVHLYEEMGVDFVTRLNGMFAIALWDARNERFVLVRDRLGVKPLYYAELADGVVFGSELKCLLQCADVPRRLDHEAVYHYFTLGYIPHPFSIYKDVRHLPPASMLVAERGEIRVKRYWKLVANVDADRSFDEACEELRALLADAVRLRMISDVPLGAFLSGGLDSSITVALMAQQSSAPVKTFHIDFEEPDFSERRFAQAVAERYGTDHHVLTVRPEAAAILDQIVQSFDEPFGDSSALPTYYVSQMTRQHVTVALAGDGGDESFGGYTRYQEILRRRRLPRMVRSMAGQTGSALHRVLPRSIPGRNRLRTLGMDHARYFAFGPQELQTRDILGPEFLSSMPDVSTWELVRPDYERTGGDDYLQKCSSLDIHRYLPDDILTKVDRMSMAHSLELRGPFLDYRVLELAATLPSSWKIEGGETKVILKRAFSRDLPPAVLAPRKRGFSAPMAKWLRNDLRLALDEALHDSNLSDAGIFAESELKQLAGEHNQGIRSHKSLLWRYLVFYRWWRQQGATLCA